MALRYSMCSTCDHAPPDDDLQQPWLLHEAQTVTHNRERDPIDTVREIMRVPTTDIHAAVGAGKSTILPRVLAAQTKLPVYMIVPNQLQATQLYDYISTSSKFSSDGVRSTLLERGDDELPPDGVAYVGASTMVSIILKRQPSQVFSNRIIYLDEAHESDAYSFTLRELGVQLGARYLVRASATFSLEKVMSARNLISDVETKAYDSDANPASWDISDPSKPWYYRQAGNTLIFTDSSSEAQLLYDEYTAYGCRTYTLTAKTPVAYFREAMASTRSDIRTVLIADYSFRSGFTFYVSRVIDTGMVYYMSGKPGLNEKLVRPMYKFESDQAKGRLGRLPGMVCEYNRPEGTLENLRTDLEGVESEAAAYLYRLLGFKPPRELTRRVMATMNHDTTRTLAQVFNDPRPLTCQKLEEPRTLPAEPDPIAPEVRPKSEILDDNSSANGSVGTVNSSAKSDSSSDDGLQWDQIVDTYKTERREPLIDGEPYCAVRVPPDIESATIPIFPLGLESVMTYAEDNHDKQRLWPLLSDREREYALAVVLRKYNIIVAEVLAIRGAVTRIIREYNLDPGEPTACQIVKSAVSNIRRLELDRRHLFNIIRRLLIYDTELINFRGIDGLVATRESYHYSSLQKSVQPVVKFDLLDYSRSYDRVAQDTLQPLTYDAHGNVLTLSSRPPGGGVGDDTILTVRYASNDVGRRYVRGTSDEAVAEYEARKTRFSRQMTAAR